MEPWQQEQLYQLQLEKRAARQPRCQCCDSPIRTEHCLDLSPFGLEAVACEGCVQKHWICTQQM